MVLSMRMDQPSCLRCERRMFRKDGPPRKKVFASPPTCQIYSPIYSTL